MNRRAIIGGLLGALLLGCGRGGDQFDQPSPEKTGVLFTNSIEETDDLNILDYLYFYNGGGVAVGDIDNDGLPDLFFSGNQVSNKLYRNLGGMQFEDISAKAGVEGKSSWNTGAVMGDVNGDGLLDIYVCAVVGINGFTGHNELYINKGDGTFDEKAGQYGLDFDTYSSNAAFLDYDLDGDLDIYLLNHAVHTQDSYGKASLRYARDYDTGDKLLRNDGDRFTDVSEEAGIYGGINGYGLGISVSDFNLDGYPDIYIGNDFHEDDYYYLNNGDGSFTESLRSAFGHTSRFSMGNDAADINNDGRPDLISLDMLPEKEVPLKSSEGDDNLQTQRMRIQEYGYYYQFTRNMLYVNQPDGQFMETALMSGVAATDWSWSALFADFDLDGHQDLFISNGIPKRPNDLDFVKFVSNEQISNKISNTKLVDQKALEMMPSGNVHNYVFQGQEGLSFEDRSADWIRKDTLLSGATAWGDLDGDGDLDLVINNLNHPASILVNKGSGNNFLSLELKFEGRNPFGIGSKVYAYTEGNVQMRELFPVRGFQASSQPLLHFGFGQATTVDSLMILWPDGSYQVEKNIPTGQQLLVEKQQTRPYDYTALHARVATPVFKKLDGNLGIDFIHEEDKYTDFNREKLLPYSLADRGPAFARGDLDGDGREDLYFGGSKRKPSRVYLQRDTTFIEQFYPGLQNDSVPEEVTAVLADFSGDEKSDLIIGVGGDDFFGKAQPLLDRYFLGTETDFEELPFLENFANTAVLRPFDFDQDGDLDLFVGNQGITGQFGAQPDSYLLENNRGEFKIREDFPGNGLGMVTDALWSDFDGDGNTDLIVVGEWMAPRFFRNENGIFKGSDTGPSGLWQALAPFDLDQDGDMDYVLGNWGLNSKFSASMEAPLVMYFSDFDANGSTETVVAISKDGAYYPLVGLDELGSQMVMLRRKYPSYRAFAGRSVAEIFTPEQLEKAELREATELGSGYLKNENGKFVFHPFPPALQTAPLMAFHVFDYDGDGTEEVLAGGNYFGVKPHQGRLDAFPGALIQGEQEVLMGNQIGLDLMNKSIRHLSVIHIDNQPYLLAVFNDAPAEVYQLTNKKNK